MCGIAGIFSLNLPLAERAAHAEKMAARLAHRGRDGQGVWSGDGITLAHRRLAVLDLSPAGAQPMTRGDLTLTYNGEIYNWREIQNALPPQEWRGHSDTEILLAAFAAWGVEKTLRQIRGMFAGGLWNAREKTLTLFRDRFGEKPLYYGRVAGAFVFASELRAFRALEFSPTVNRAALAQLLARGCCRDCIWENFYKLPPAAFCTLTAEELRTTNCELRVTPYWSAREIALAAEPFTGTFADAAEEVEELLRAAAAEQTVADVPVGALLSGGIDSTLLVALLAERQSIKTFTIGFRDRAFDEAPAARAIAAHLQTEHHEFYFDESDALALAEKIPQIYDEPFADSSQLPTFLVCRAARRLVAAALTGDGGDELFGGYQRYLAGDKFWRYWRHLPLFFRRAAQTLTPSSAIGKWGNRLGAVFPSPYPRRWGDKYARLARAFAAKNFAEFYGLLTATGAENLVADLPPSPPTLAGDWSSLAAQAMLIDQENYLPDDLLVKIDRAAMAHTLETRAPLLDCRLAALAWRLPMNYKIRGATGKIILRKILARRLPDALLSRQKKGFGVPLAQWLRGGLRDWGESLLTPARLQNDGFFTAPAVTKMWNEHQSGKRDHAAALWAILVFQAWQEQS
ncbi:MAG: asparagine synthase (glutamine-hydrolyzing) [Planctomycetota bacterium]|nr:asparagine synthase (glutamine-hydrolyzing) [Planctomycetota bacterium]